MIRAVIVAATIAALIALWIDRPKPVKSVQVDYCKVTVRAAVKDDAGEWQFGWAHIYDTCSLLDRYENT
jgi:hypothetical protein